MDEILKHGKQLLEGAVIKQLTPSLRTRRLGPRSPRTKEMASMRFDLPAIEAA